MPSRWPDWLASSGQVNMT